MKRCNAAAMLPTPLIRTVLIGLFMTAALPWAKALWVTFSDKTPVQRLIRNLTMQLEKDPSNAHLYYCLARVQSLAFAERARTLAVRWNEETDLPQFLPHSTILVSGSGPFSEQDKDYLRQSIQNYRQAARLAPQQAMHHLGLGWVLEQGLDIKGVEVELEEALQAYRKAFDLTHEADLKLEFLGPQAISAISLEAAQGLIRLLPRTPKSPQREAEVERLKGALKALRKKPTAITPIIFPLTASRSLSDLLAPGLAVAFDMDGDGEAGSWPWVKPDTAILVWDPEDEQRIVSGRQLFGSVTWWISWRHGYEPLQALDDNSDGWLSGEELKGLSVWQDRDSDGLSDRGEVRPASQLGIRSLAVRQQVEKTGLHWNPCGVQLQDGRFLPSYDWTPKRIPSLDLLPIPVI